MSEMLDYIIKMPPADSSHDRGHKYPFTVSELFACEISQLNELFFTAPPPVVSKKVDAEKEANNNNSDQEAVEVDNNEDDDDDMPKLETVKVGSSSSSSEESGNSDDDEEKNQKEEEPPKKNEDSAVAKGTSLQYEIADGLEVIEGEGENEVTASGDQVEEKKEVEDGHILMHNHNTQNDDEEVPAHIL